MKVDGHDVEMALPKRPNDHAGSIDSIDKIIFIDVCFIELTDCTINHMDPSARDLKPCSVWLELPPPVVCTTRDFVRTRRPPIVAQYNTLKYVLGLQSPAFAYARYVYLFFAAIRRRLLLNCRSISLSGMSTYTLIDYLTKEISGFSQTTVFPGKSSY